MCVLLRGTGLPELLALSADLKLAQKKRAAIAQYLPEMLRNSPSRSLFRPGRYIFQYQRRNFYTVSFKPSVLAVVSRATVVYRVRERGESLSVVPLINRRFPALTSTVRLPNLTFRHRHQVATKRQFKAGGACTAPEACSMFPDIAFER